MISLTNQVVSDSAPAGSVVGRLVAWAPWNLKVPVSYTISNDGGGLFAIVGEDLITVWDTPPTPGLHRVVVDAVGVAGQYRSSVTFMIIVGDVPVPVITIEPPAPHVDSTTPLGAVVAQVSVEMSDGSPFRGVLGFGPPNFDAGGVFTLDATNQLIVDPDGPGVGESTTVVLDHITLMAV